MKVLLKNYTQTFFLSVLCLIFACKKYDDDTEFIHLKRVKKRIEGKKRLIMHRMGKTDLMPYWKSRFGEFYLDFTLKPENPYKSGYGFDLKVYDINTDTLICDGFWYYVADAYQIGLEFNCLDQYIGEEFPNNLQGISYPTVKLSEKDLWMRAYSQNPISRVDELIEARFLKYEF